MTLISAEKYNPERLVSIQKEFQLASCSEERLFQRQELRAWEEEMMEISRWAVVL